MIVFTLDFVPTTKTPIFECVPVAHHPNIEALETQVPSNHAAILHKYENFDRSVLPYSSACRTCPGRKCSVIVLSMAMMMVQLSDVYLRGNRTVSRLVLDLAPGARNSISRDL